MSSPVDSRPGGGITFMPRSNGNSGNVWLITASHVYAAPGTMKHYDRYEDEFGEEIEVHYFRHPDGSVGDVKVKPPS